MSDVYEVAEVTLSGVPPGLMMQSGRSIDPLDPLTKLMSPIRKMREKTDFIHQQLADLEFICALYTTQPGGVQIEESGEVTIDGFGNVCLPGDALEASIIQGAKSFKKGTAAKTSFLFEPYYELLIDGAPLSVKEAWRRRSEFSDRRPVGIRDNRVMKTRPLFREWTVKMRFSYLANVFNKKTVADIIERAGAVAAVGTYRPRFGRFTADDVTLVEANGRARKRAA